MIGMSYKKLLVWQKGMEIANDVYDLTRTFPKEEMFGLVSQMRRRAVSVPSNIAEGSQQISQRAFGQFTLIAKGSLVGLETQLLIAQQQNIGQREPIEMILLKADELGRMLHAFHRKLLARTSQVSSPKSQVPS